MKKSIVHILLLCGLLAGTFQTALAQGTIYTSRALFEQQANSVTTIAMESLPPSRNADFLTGSGQTNITVEGVSITCLSGRLFVAAPGHLAYPIPGDGQYIWNVDSGAPVGILLPGGVTAFATDFAGGINTTFTAAFTVNLSGGASYAYNMQGFQHSWSFFGITFAEPITSVVFDDGGSSFPALHNEILDNVTFGSAIPEPNALCFFALGGVLFGWRFVRKRQRPSQSRHPKAATS